MGLGVNTPDIQQQMDQLFSSILLEQQKFNKIQKADESKKQHMLEKIKTFETYRGRAFFYSYLSTGRGHGPFTELLDGSVKYDLINGIGVNILGHSHPLAIRAHLEAATTDIVMCGNLAPYEQAYEATRSIVEAVKGKSRLNHFWFAGSGSFANDTALKLLWQKRAPRYKVLAFTKCFAGRSIAMQDVTYNAAYREGMPKTIQVEHVPHYDQKNPGGSLEKTLNALEAAWTKDPDAYAALSLEFVQGEGGFIYGTKNYYEEIFKWAKAKNIPIWVDEVQSFARTRELFAFQMFGLDEYVDIVTLAKAFQACGVLFTDELNPKPGLIAGTFVGSVSALNLASKTVKFLKEGNFYGPEGRMSQLEKKFFDGLEALKSVSSKEKVTYFCGVGTMIAFEIGKGDADTTNKFLKRLFDNGVMAFSAGKEPTRVRFLLPITLSDDHIKEIFSIIENTLKEL